MVVLGVLVAVLSSGCGAMLSVGSDQASLSGSPEGIRAMLDGMNGLIQNGKASPDKTTAHSLMRGEQEREYTKRAMKPGFFSNLLSRNAASNVTNVDTGGPGVISTIK